MSADPISTVRARLSMQRHYGKIVPVQTDDLDALLKHLEALEANLALPTSDARPAVRPLPPASTEARIERARTVAWLRAMAAQWETHADLVGSGLAGVWRTVATLLENREPERWTQELHELHEED